MHSAIEVGSPSSPSSPNRWWETAWSRCLALFVVLQLLYWLVLYPAMIVPVGTLTKLPIHTASVATPQSAQDDVNSRSFAPVELPYQDCCESGYRALRMRFDLDVVPAAGLALMPIVGSDNYRLWINDSLLYGEGEMAQATLTYHGNVRTVFRMPSALLKPGVNEIRMLLARDAGAPYFFVAPPVVGDYNSIKKAYRVRTFLLNDYNTISISIGLTLAALAGLVLWRSSSKLTLLWLFVLFAAWSLRLLYYDLTDPPLRGEARMVALYLMVNLLPVAWLNLANHWGERPLRWVATVSLSAYSLISVAVALILFGGWFERIDTADALSMGFSFVCALATLAIFLPQLRRIRRDQALEIAMFGLCVSLVVVDGFQGMFGHEGGHHIATSMPVLMLGLATAFLAGKVRLFQSASQINRLLGERLAQRETELQAAHARERDWVRRQAHDEERRSVLRDMHDGVGSQLMSMLLAARRGIGDPATVAEGLQSVVDEMRLMIDSMDSVGESVGAALATFRERAMQRVQAAGFALQWQQPPDVRLPGYGPRDLLHVFRILQEAVANALQHSGGHTITIDVAAEQDGLRLSVSDDGKGISSMAHAAGNGLRNMQARAEGIGATLSTNAPAPGHSVVLWLPARASAQPTV